jgi:glycosyltransferase involved in cell wall biosynthesis
MNIAIDLSPLQGPHRLRGIGSTIINLVSNISIEDRKNHTFVFFLYPESDDGYENPIKLIDTSGMNFSVRNLNRRHNVSPHSKSNTKAEPQSLLQNVIGRLLRRLRQLTAVPYRHINELLIFYKGDKRISDMSNIDIFLQTDQSLPLPRKTRCRRVLVVYDLIPYILEKDYLNSYTTARRKGLSIKAALRCAYYRWQYLKKLKINARHADRLIAISSHTAKDFHEVVGVPKHKIRISQLGISTSTSYQQSAPPQLHKYRHTSWGDFTTPVKLDPGTPFILYVGGADSRRKLEDLVAAFNNMRAKGSNVKLILVGDSMYGPNRIATKAIRDALKKSSYADDILYFGFVNDHVRDWLYSNARAFVFPSRYEGFGLPILEAMGYGCPVICYRNEAVMEVADDAPIYADGVNSLIEAIESVFNMSDEKRQSIIDTGIIQAKKYSWQKTSKSFIKNLI